MQPLAIGASAYRRQAAQVPSAQVENYYYEKSDTAGAIWMPRPGLVKKRAGNAGLRGIFREPGCLGGDLLIVVGTSAIRVTQSGAETVLGVVAGSGLVTIAGSLAGAMIANGQDLFYTTGGALVTLSLPFDDPVSIEYAAGYWLSVAGGTQKRYYAIDGDPTVWNALNFDSASERPDPLVTSKFVAGRLFDFGERTTEFRYPSGDSTAPFQTEFGRAFMRGCLSANSVVLLDNTAIWVGDDKIVYRAADVPQALSDAFLSEEISRCDGVYAHGLTWQGHVFYCLTLVGVGTYVFDLTTNSWAKWSTYGSDRWLPSIGCVGWDNEPLLGDVATGNLYQLSSEVYSDDGAPIVGILTAGVLVEGQRVTSGMVRLNVSTGHVRYPETAEEPQVGLEISRDGGNTYSSKMLRGLGLQGEYYKRVVWRRLGQFRPPGVMLRFTVSDPVPRRITGAYLDGRF